MEIRELTAVRRTETGKQVAKRLRRQGQVPGVLYGGSGSIPITLDPKTVLRLLSVAGGTTVLNLRFTDGHEGNRNVIIRDLQFDPVSEALIHVDLQEVMMDRAITVTVAIHAVGEAAGVKEQGGILELILREVQVSCLPGLIPDRIGADVSQLRIGAVLTIADLRPPEGVRILNDPGQAVATVSPPMAEEVVAPAAPVAPTEPEVLTERKPKVEEPKE